MLEGAGVSKALAGSSSPLSTSLLGIGVSHVWRQPVPLDVLTDDPDTLSLVHVVRVEILFYCGLIQKGAYGVVASMIPSTSCWTSWGVLLRRVGLGPSM